MKSFVVHDAEMVVCLLGMEMNVVAFVVVLRIKMNDGETFFFEAFFLIMEIVIHKIKMLYLVQSLWIYFDS